MQQIAYLSSKNEYSTFVFGERTITFLTSKNLERYIRVVNWDHGYLVVISYEKRIFKIMTCSAGLIRKSYAPSFKAF